MAGNNIDALLKTARMAIGRFAEPVEWQQDASPRKRATFPAVCLFQTADTASAGHPLGAVTADSWKVIISDEVGYAAEIAVGDTIKRINLDAQEMSVQEVTRRNGRWHLVCTANERSPS